ncbi:hypothetical protein [Sporosarcina sp. G11-34]|uniref:hypothetical protein n=1 Tax=Sporosarcina sp. G11-34 TaxID=2849605 RepID=UPI0022A911C5|nr:hypothetical protein [Sporosarcina sp. G11-34]MCZ2259861.1 hypothetical protein [Sporosarcina sp. G11-34]
MKKDKKPFYKRWWFIAIAVILVINIFGNIGKDDEPTAEPVTKEESKSEKSEKEDKAKQETKDEETNIEEESNEKVEVEEKEYDQSSLGFGIDELRDRFDSNADEYSLPFRSNRDTKVEEGEVYDGLILANANDFINVRALLTKEKSEVRQIMMVAQGDGTEQSGFNILVTIGVLIASTNPELSADERGEILTELTQGAQGGEVDISITKNNVEYTFNKSDLLGIMFFAEVAKD